MTIEVDLEEEAEEVTLEVANKEVKTLIREVETSLKEVADSSETTENSEMIDHNSMKEVDI